MSNGAASAPAARRPGRLTAWVVLVGLLAAASYGARLAGGETPDDVLYLWSTFVGAVIQYGIMLVLVLAIAHGFDRAPPRDGGSPAALARGAAGSGRTRRDHRGDGGAQPVSRRR